MNHKQFKLCKGLVEKVLDLYYNYCELRLPFKIDDHFELFEFDLIYLPSMVISNYDNYKYIKPIDLELDRFQCSIAHLSFNWDEITSIQLWFEVSDKKLVDKVINTEKLYIVETIEYIKLIYNISGEKVELVMNKSRDNSK